MQHSSHSLDCDPLLTHPPLPLSPLCTLHSSPLSIMYPPLFPSLHYVPSTLPLSPLCTLHSSPLSIMYPPLSPSLHYVPSTLPLSPLCTLHSSPLSIMYPPLFPSLHYVPSTLPLSPLCTLHSSPLSIMYPPLFPSLHLYFNVYMYMHFDQWWATPSGLLPWDSHQTMTSVLVWDTGQPNG